MFLTQQRFECGDNYNSDGFQESHPPKFYVKQTKIIREKVSVMFVKMFFLWENCEIVK